MQPALLRSASSRDWWAGAGFWLAGTAARPVFAGPTIATATAARHTSSTITIPRRLRPWDMLGTSLRELDIHEPVEELPTVEAATRRPARRGFVDEAESARRDEAGDAGGEHDVLVEQRTV